jgi:hypothetical protein
LPRRFTLNGWSTLLKKNRVGVWLRVVEHDLHRPRDLDLTLNAPPDRHPSCAPTYSIAMRRL